MPTEYFFPMFPRLEPHTPWTGGRITDTDTVTLLEAASMATIHAGQTVTAGDFLRAAGRGEIALRAIIHHTAKVQSHDGGIYCNAGQDNENTAPAGAIPTLPLTACQHLAATGRAAWRTFDGFEIVDGELMRYTKGLLIDGEPDFETVPDDCRVTGNHVHALADAFKTPDNAKTETEPQAATPPAPVMEAPASDTPQWKMRIQIEAAAHMKRLRAAGASPTVSSILDRMVTWCRENEVMTDGSIYPSAGYLRTHVLGGNHWTPPRR